MKLYAWFSSSYTPFILNFNGICNYILYSINLKSKNNLIRNLDINKEFFILINKTYLYQQ